MVDIADDLYAKAMVLNDGNTTIAIVTTDLLWVPANMTAEIRRIVKEKTGISGSNVLISASHTHYVPKNYARHVTAAPLDSAYVKTLMDQIAGAVFIAHKNMNGVKIGVGKGEVPEIIYNRRTKRADGSTVINFSLPPDTTGIIFGPKDPEVGVIRVEDEQGNIVASMMNFACHPTSAGYGNYSYLYSADYPGYAMKVVEQIEGGICLFTLGAAGDIVVIERGLKQRRQIGTAIGSEALRLLQRTRTSDNVSIKVAQKFIRLPLKDKLPTKYILFDDVTQKYLTTEIQAFSIGDIFILGLPGEILVEIGLDIKKQFGEKNLFVVSLSNDIVGYVCHSAAYDEGKYEPDEGTNLAKGSGEIMINEALELLSNIR